MASTLTFDASLSGQYSNSYCDLNFATTYFANHYIATSNTAWAALEPLQQQQLLIAACRIIETARFTNYVRPSDYQYMYDYTTGQVRQLADNAEPVRYLNIQSLQFPRNLDIDEASGASFIPVSIKLAQCEQAIYLLSYDGSAIAARMQGISSEAVSLGKGQIHSSVQYTGEGSAFSPMALEYCRPYFLKGGARMRRA